MSLILAQGSWRRFAILKLLQDFSVKTNHKGHKFDLAVSKADLVEMVAGEQKEENGWDFSSDLQERVEIDQNINWNVEKHYFKWK